MVHDNDNRYEHIVDIVGVLPRKIISLQGVPHISEFILHHITQPASFNISKAALFIDNPDFNVMQGMVGIDHAHGFSHQKSHWDCPEEFSEHMQHCSFHKQVRDLCHCSVTKNKNQEEKVMQGIFENLSFKNPAYITWPMKHENSGILVFEKEPDYDHAMQQHLEDAVHFLGFCPVY